MLAVRVVQEQGIHVEAINFYTGFCVEGHTHAIRKKEGPPKRNNALWVAEQLGIKLHILDISEPYKEIVLRPNTATARTSIPVGIAKCSCCSMRKPGA